MNSQKKRKTKVSSVLLVDDRAHFVHDLAAIFQIEGFRVDAASSVDEAVKLLRSHHYDLMICDMMMPPGDLLDELSTQGDLRTGIFFCQYVKIHYPEMLSIILTAGSVLEFDKDFLFGNNIKILSKGEVTQVDVVNYCKKLNPAEERVAIADIIELKPGMFGIKMDIKKVYNLLKSYRKK